MNLIKGHHISFHNSPEVSKCNLRWTKKKLCIGSNKKLLIIFMEDHDSFEWQRSDVSFIAS